MSGIFTTLLTGKDNRSLDIARVAMLIGITAICVCLISGVAVYALAAHEFDLGKLGEFIKNFATSFSEIVGIGSASVAVKAHAEPEANDGDH